MDRLYITSQLIYFPILTSLFILSKRVNDLDSPIFIHDYFFDQRAYQPLLILDIGRSPDLIEILREFLELLQTRCFLLSILELKLSTPQLDLESIPVLFELLQAFLDHLGSRLPLLKQSE